jgi:AraC-like DNA-binding protein
MPRARGAAQREATAGAKAVTAPAPARPDTLELSRLQLVSVAHMSPDMRWHIPAHDHPFHELIIVFGGVLHVRITGMDIAAAAGDVLFYHRGVEHEEWSDPGQPAETCFIVFKLASGLDAAPVLVRDAVGRLRQLVLWLHEERNVVSDSSTRVRAQFARALISEWLRLATLREHEIVRWLREFVERNESRLITLDELAYGAGMSKYHYARLYKHLAGCTPMEDVRRTRVRMAQHLILTTDLPLKDVAWRCGLGDQYHMSKLFRRLLDVTPGEMRVSVRRARPRGGPAGA